jgi:microcystin degradation protein MlrC
MRIAIASFVDETMTFLKEPTTEARFEPGTRRGREIVEGNEGIPTYINGYLRVLAAEGAEAVPIVEARKAPGPFSSWITKGCFERYTGEIVQGITQAGRLDGVLLSLHGAMAVDGIPKPEAEITRRVRSVVGSIPIMITLDLHANEDHELTDASDGVFILKTYPHVDSEEIGMVAARCMVSTVRGDVRPIQVCRKPGLASPSIFQGSYDQPMKAIYDRCREWEQRKNVYCVSVAPGFAYADVPDVAMSVIAVTDGEPSLARDAADDISALAWSLRDAFVRRLPGAKDAVAQVMQLVAGGRGPVVMADGADRIGDSTHVLRELIAQGARNWAVPGINDPVVARDLEAHAKLGDRVTVSIGGWYGELSGQPVEVSGVVEYAGRPEYKLVGPMGLGRPVKEGFVIRLNLGDNRHVVIADRTRGANDSTGFTSVGIDVDTLDIIPLKSRVHHRAFWDTVGKVNFPIDVPGYFELVDLSQFEYRNLPADVYPIGRNWRAART